MGFMPLPHRVQDFRATEYRHGGEIREGFDDLTSSLCLPHLLGVTIEMSPPRRRHRRTAGVLLLVLAAGALMLAYRWRRGRGREVARPVLRPSVPEDARPPSPVVPPPAETGSGADDAPSTASTVPAPSATPDEPPRAQPRRLQGPAAASAPVRPQWRLGRGPSTAPPPVPAVRPTLPGHPHPRLPR